MNLQDVIAILSVALAVGGAIYSYIGGIEKRFDEFSQRTDKRVDDLSIFVIRVDQRCANVERQVYGDNITEFLRSGKTYHPNEDDTEFS